MFNINVDIIFMLYMEKDWKAQACLCGILSRGEIRDFFAYSETVRQKSQLFHEFHGRLTKFATFSRNSLFLWSVDLKEISNKKYSPFQIQNFLNVFFFIVLVTWFWILNTWYLFLKKSYISNSTSSDLIKLRWRSNTFLIVNLVKEKIDY